MYKSIARSIVLAAFILVGLTFSLHAGPPLICHGVDLKAEKSLPWGKDAFEKDKDYNTANVVRDTQELLTREMPVIARMETLRRATLYINRDRERADALLGSLMARALDADAVNKPDALAYFDAGYLAGCYDQTETPTSFGPSVTKGDGASAVAGYAWLAKAISLDPKRPEFEMAATLMVIDTRGSDREKHLKAALAAGLPNSPQSQSLMQWIAQIHGTTLDGLRAKFNLTDARNSR